jgi:hypothetical protein
MRHRRPPPPSSPPADTEQGRARGGAKEEEEDKKRKGSVEAWRTGAAVTGGVQQLAGWGGSQLASLVFASASKVAAAVQQGWGGRGRERSSAVLVLAALHPQSSCGGPAPLLAELLHFLPLEQCRTLLLAGSRLLHDTVFRHRLIPLLQQSRIVSVCVLG